MRLAPSTLALSIALAAAIAATGGLLAACTQSQSLPRQLGSCEADAATCSTGVPGGGAGIPSEAGASPTACGSTVGSSQCTACADTNCCPSFNACTSNLECSTLLNCEQTCEVAACFTSCQQQSLAGVGLLNNLTSCLSLRCPVCNQVGNGDPCGGSLACNPGLTCNGEWCTEPCVHSSQCTGLGAGGGNSLGIPNACIVTASNGAACAAGCNGDVDCSAFPGSFCQSLVSADGLDVRVCSAPPDAGAD